MTAQTGATTERPTQTEESSLASRDVTRLYHEGLIAGLIGAATVAVWFLIIDVIQGRPLYTPTVLGAALFHRGAVPWLDTAPDLEMVLMFTWIHGLAFIVVGGVIARLLAIAERQPNAGFGILMLFVLLEFGFIAAAMLFAQPVLQALAWPAILVANLLAAAAMGSYFWRRHPDLRVEP